MKGWEEPTWALVGRGKAPGCPVTARGPGRPPSPRCWPAPASGWTSRADAGPWGHAAGLPVARTFPKRGGDSERDISKVFWQHLENGILCVSLSPVPLGLLSSPGRLCFQKSKSSCGEHAFGKHWTLAPERTGLCSLNSVRTAEGSCKPNLAFPPTSDQHLAVGTTGQALSLAHSPGLVRRQGCQSSC